MFNTQTVFWFVFGVILGLLIISPFPKKSKVVKPNVEISGAVLPYKALENYNIVPINSEQEKYIVENEIKNILNSASGSFGLYVKYLNTDEYISINGDQKYYAASLFKIPLAIASMKASDENAIDFESISDLLFHLLKESNNGAQDALMESIPYYLIEEVFSSISTDNNFENSNISSPEEISKYFEELYKPKLISKKSSSYLLDLMTDTIFEDRFSLGIQKDIRFAHKIGNWPETGSWHDCGIVYKDDPFIICLMSENTTLKDSANVAKKILRYL